MLANIAPAAYAQNLDKRSNLDKRTITQLKTQPRNADLRLEINLSKTTPVHSGKLIKRLYLSSQSQ